MSGILRFSKANPIRMVITSWQNRNANDLDYQMFRDYSLPSNDSYFQPFLNTDTLTIQFDSSFDSTNTITLKNYNTGATVNTQAATEIVDNTTYQVYQNNISISGLSGLYYVEVTGSDADAQTYTAVSEPLEIRASHCNTVLMSYYNNEVAFGIDYRSGVTFYMRIPAYFNRTDDEEDLENFTDSGGNETAISAEINRQRILKISRLVPQWVIEKINFALVHDYCDINSVRVVAYRLMPYQLISNRKLWGEPEVTIRLQSGYSGFFNSHDSGSRESL